MLSENSGKITGVDEEDECGPEMKKVKKDKRVTQYDPMGRVKSYFEGSNDEWAPEAREAAKRKREAEKKNPVASYQANRKKELEEKTSRSRDSIFQTIEQYVDAQSFYIVPNEHKHLDLAPPRLYE